MSGIYCVWNLSCLELHCVRKYIVCMYVCGRSIIWGINVHGRLIYVAVAGDSASHSSDGWMDTAAAVGAGGH